MIIETGYAPLMHQVYKIYDFNSANKLLNSILDMKLLSYNKKSLMRNSGSIFNSWISAFSISKIIFDHILNFDVSEYGEFDFLQNRYFLGSNYNKDYYDLYSKEIQKNMKYRFVNNNNIEISITKDNIYSINLELTDFKDYYINDFLYRKFSFSDFEFYEECSYKLYNLVDFNFKLNLEKINNYFVDYVVNNYNVNIDDLNYIINNKVIEYKNNNSIPQQLIRKIDNKFIIFNQNYNNDFERIIGRIHELFHYIFYTITDCPYEHENFVMNNEISFYKFLFNKDKNFLNIFYFYLYNIFHKHIINFISLSYEKSLYLRDFTVFKENNKSLISDNLDGLLHILNSNIKFNNPFYTLKYFRAFEQNKLNIISMYNFILNNKEIL